LETANDREDRDRRQLCFHPVRGRVLRFDHPASAIDV
jgi:hypothetical protein